MVNVSWLSFTGRLVATVVTGLVLAVLMFSPEVGDTVKGAIANSEGYYSGKMYFAILAVPSLFIGIAAGWLADILGFGQQTAAPTTAARVRMLTAPPGNEPEAVRAAWVGMLLSLVPGETGSRPVGRSGEPGQHEWVFLVDAPAALDRLAKHNPEAAAWWRQHAPERWRPGERFVFGTDVCELHLPELEEAERGPSRRSRV